MAHDISAGKNRSSIKLKHKLGLNLTKKHSNKDQNSNLTNMAAARMVPAAAEAYGRIATLTPSFKVSLHFRDKQF
jgi:hypothetical protein